MIGIYKFTNRFNRKTYIGKSINIEARYNNHIHAARKNCDGYFYNALRKYGEEGFDFEILIDLSWLNGNSKEDIKKVLDYWEKFYIKYYCSTNRAFGYNRTYGGDGISFWDEEMRYQHRLVHLGQESPMKGKHHKDESKQLLREANLGKKQSQETIEKRRQKLLGHTTSPETAKKIGDSQRGKVTPKKTRDKISNSLQGHEPWNKGKRGYHIKKSGKRTPEQCENIRRGRWGDKNTSNI